MTPEIETTNCSPKMGRLTRRGPYDVLGLNSMQMVDDDARKTGHMYI
jgi:hypothetical protein